MNDTPPPEAAKPSPVQGTGEGSLALGVALAWVIIVGGYILIAALLMLGSTMSNFFPGVGYAVLAVAPEIAAALVAVTLINRGKRRTGKGILIGLASFAAVALLLVAACFGLLFSSNL